MLRKVLVSFGDRIGYATTLEDALAEVFGEAQAENGGGTGNGNGNPDLTAQQDLTKALADAQAAIIASDAALKAGDFTAYGAAQKQLEDAIGRAVAAEAEIRGGPAPSASASPGASPSPSASAASASFTP